MLKFFQIWIIFSKMLSTISYNIITTLISTYKWIELQVLKIFVKQLEKKGLALLEPLGIVFHFPEDGDNYSPATWTADQEKEALSKCKASYTKLIHIKINNKTKYLTSLANQGTLGSGECWMDQVWECYGDDIELVEFGNRILDNGYIELYYHSWNRFLEHCKLTALNLQSNSKDGSGKVAELHYDLGNDLYEAFLDPHMMYSCGYWAKANNLNDAQVDKMELIAKKLKLEPGMKLLDIGCGWGTLCKYLAEKYGVHCVGVTISKEQAEYAMDKCKGLPVEIRVQDYRDVYEKFDRMVSVGMLEHVGYKNYKEYFEVARRNLTDDGIFLVHTIGINHAEVPRSEAWYHKYIFPNSNLPYPTDLTQATFGKFIIEDWHNFGPDYEKTLRAWWNNFVKNWPGKLEKKYGDRFYRMWLFYLGVSMSVFATRKTHVWQVVLSKNGLRPEYRAIR